MATVLRLQKQRYFIAGARLTNTPCKVVICGCGSGSSSGPSSDLVTTDPDCVHDWVDNPDCVDIGDEGCTRCEIDINDLPEIPPTWFLEALEDFLADACGDPSPPLNLSTEIGLSTVCDYVAVIQYAILNGSYPNDGTQSYQAWLDILGWWESVGADVVVKYCLFGDDPEWDAGTDLIPGISQLQVMVTTIQLPAGSYPIGDPTCEDIAINEECPECES